MPLLYLSVMHHIFHVDGIYFVYYFSSVGINVNLPSYPSADLYSSYTMGKY